MMRSLILLIAAVLFSTVALAQPNKADLIGLGVPSEQAKAFTDPYDSLILEDSTSASACAGSSTLTADTPVVITTTCINTGDYIFITRTSLDVGDEFADTIVDGTSFAVTSITGDTATFNWLIVKGQ
jgi:hypothetical protein